jgi:membrane protease YdiL (CAAX protease family)
MQVDVIVDVFNTCFSLVFLSLLTSPELRKKSTDSFNNLIFWLAKRIFRTVNKNYRPSEPYENSLAFSIKRPSNLFFTALFWVVVVNLFLKFVLGYKLIPYDEPLPLPVVFILRSVFTPISEEIIFRGLLLGAFANLFFLIFQKIKAYERVVDCFFLVISSLIFMAAHNNYNFSILDLPRLFFGLLYGYLYLSSGKNLAPPIIAHGLHNALVLTQVFNLF